MSARALLRSSTAAEHERVDALFSGFDLSSADDYRRFLVAQAAAFIPCERALEQGGVVRLVPDWEERRRSDLLCADLHALAVPAPAAAPTPFSFPGDAALLGALYVLEGSRLGGALLKRQVPSGLPRRFLDAPQPPGAWQSLLILLDKQLQSHDEAQAAAEAARGVFKQFEASASTALRAKTE